MSKFLCGVESQGSIHESYHVARCPDCKELRTLIAIAPIQRRKGQGRKAKPCVDVMGKPLMTAPDSVFFGQESKCAKLAKAEGMSDPCASCVGFDIPCVKVQGVPCEFRERKNAQRAESQDLKNFEFLRGLKIGSKKQGVTTL